MKSITPAQKAGEVGYAGTMPRPRHSPAIPHCCPLQYSAVPYMRQPYPKLCLSPQKEDFFAPQEPHALKASTTCPLQPAAEARHPPSTPEC